MKDQERRKECGFTLLELLIVVALILILLLLLLPATDYLLFKAKCIKCVANLRQWGVACTSYAADHNGDLPRFNNRGPQNGCLWDIGPTFYSSTNLNSTNTLLAPYGVNMLSMYGCPLVNDSAWFPPGTGGAYGDDVWFYGYNVWMYRSSPINAGFPVFDINGDGVIGSAEFVSNGRVPNNYPLMSCGARLDSFQSFPLPNNVIQDQGFGPHMWKGHLENIPVLYVDGHVVIRQPSQFKDRYSMSFWPSGRAHWFY